MSARLSSGFLLSLAALALGPGASPYSSLVGGGPALKAPTPMSVTSTGLLYSRVTRLYSETLMARNTGTQVIAGPVQIVLTNLTPGVTLANATGMTNGSPCITVPDSVGLAAGQTASVNVEFYKHPSFPRIFGANLAYRDWRRI